jgi:hypothetical protein
MKTKKNKPTSDSAVGVGCVVSLPNEILIEVEGRQKRVLTKDYVTAKTKQLQEFGYTKLTEEEVSSELQNILSNKPLNVIGMFMKDDIVRSN